MILLLTLLSLCATECRVHQAGSTWCWVKPPKDSCIVNSHWLPCVVQEKCDTVCLSNGVAGSTYRITCHPETTLVDSGVVDDGWWFSAPDGKVEIRKPADEDTLWIFDTPFLRSEMPDLKEMLREWRVEKCVASAYRHWGRDWIFPDEEKRIADSCECVYGSRKDGSK